MQKQNARVRDSVEESHAPAHATVERPAYEMVGTTSWHEIHNTFDQTRAHGRLRARQLQLHALQSLSLSLLHLGGWNVVHSFSDASRTRLTTGPFFLSPVRFCFSRVCFFFQPLLREAERLFSVFVLCIFLFLLLSLIFVFLFVILIFKILCYFEFLSS